MTCTTAFFLSIFYFKTQITFKLGCQGRMSIHQILHPILTRTFLLKPSRHSAFMFFLTKAFRCHLVRVSTNKLLCNLSGGFKPSLFFWKPLISIIALKSKVTLILIITCPSRFSMINLNMKKFSNSLLFRCKKCRNSTLKNLKLRLHYKVSKPGLKAKLYCETRLKYCRFKSQ